MRQKICTSTTMFYLLAAGMITCYLAANVMAVRLVEIGGVCWFDAGTLIFPMTYLLGEVVTELWGVRKARHLIYLTFACQLLFVLFTWIGHLMPYPQNMTNMVDAYDRVFLFTPRIMLASLSAFLVGELTNAHLMDYIKQRLGGPMWVRTVSSSLVGYTLDTSIFVLIAFSTVADNRQLWSMIGIQIACKIMIEICFSTPIAYAMVHWIRKRILFT